MINVSIYVNSQDDAEMIVKDLMEARLFAHASIDKDNSSYSMENGAVVRQVNYVITGQTKGLLFNEIVKYIEGLGMNNIRIFSIPITQCNEAFSEIIRSNTKKI